jgi:signal peptidase II
MPEARSAALPRLLLWGCVALAVFLVDQWTKQMIVRGLSDGAPMRLTSFFSLVLAYNTGAAFSFLAGAGGWQRELFIAIAAVASAVIAWMVVKHPTESLFCAALALILGGALGNLYDRVTLGRVIDFLLFHYQRYAFPAFNAADSAITVGAGLLILDSFRTKRPTAGASRGSMSQ